MSDSEAMDTTPVGEELDTSEQVTPDTSTVETPTTEKRWNLRQRKPPPAPPPAPKPKAAKAKTPKAKPAADTSNDSMSVEESPDKTPQPKAPKRRAPRTKTPATKRKSKPNNSPMNESLYINSASMFTAVFEGKSAIKTVASDWVDRYEMDSELSMLELVMFIVRCCGGVSHVYHDDISGDLTEAIRTITEKFIEKSHDYPLNVGGAAQKKFKNNFSEFIWRLIEQCQHTLIFDGFMLETLVAWLVGFSDSQVRAFRHTATLAGVKLLSALIEVTNRLTTEVDNAQRQIDSETKKQQSKKTEAGLNKLQTLHDRQKQLQEQASELEEAMKNLFSSIFVHRYRDKKPEIRAICIKELGEWLQSYSSKYLEDSYLKYVGWMLFDKAAEVRAACVTVLERLYGDPDIASIMGLFTGRFKERLVSMRLDIEDSVAVVAINVLEHMQKLKLLSMEDCQEVCELVFLENRGISHAAGRFTVNYLFYSDDFISKAKLRKPPKGCKQATDELIMLHELIKFFLEVRIHQHATYFVDSLWEHTDVLQDWQAYCELLLGDQCPVKLSGDEEEALIEIMTCSIKRATGATPPPGRSKGRMISQKEKKANETSKVSISIQFMPVLPQLIEKFGSSYDNALNLVTIPRYIELELYAENRLQAQLEDLLEKLHHLVMKHHQETVFHQCALTYLSLSDKEFSLHGTTEIAFQRLLDEVVDTFTNGFNIREDIVMGDEEDEECVAMIVNTQRLASLFSLHNLGPAKFCDSMTTLVTKGSQNNYSEKIIANALTCLKADLMWRVQQIEESENYDKEVLRDILLLRKKLFSMCEERIKLSTGPARREAFVTLSDLFAVFSKHLGFTNPQMASLAYQAPPHLQDTLDDYIRNNVLYWDEEDPEPSSEEEALQLAERLNDRRILLAGYLKMGLFGSVAIDRLSVVWAEYVNQYSNFGDLIKYSMGKSREHNPVGWAKTVSLALQSVFTSYRDENKRIDQQSAEWADIKDLARKFAMSLGVEHTKARLPLVTLHRECIQFALWDVDPNVPVDELIARKRKSVPISIDFFTILNEFSYRLLAVDRTGEKGIVAFLTEQLPPNTLEAVEAGQLIGWDPLLNYYNTVTLQAGKGTKSVGAAVAPPSTIQSNQARARKRPLKINDSSILNESSISRPSKLSRMEDTPPSMVDLETSAESAEPPTPVHGSTEPES